MSVFPLDYKFLEGREHILFTVISLNERKNKKYIEVRIMQ